MDHLHLIRSQPEGLTEKLMAQLSHDNESRCIRLYDDDLDWEEVVEAIFRHKNVVCWW